MRTEPLLRIYAGVVTAALAVTLLAGFAREKRETAFDDCGAPS
jgi:hypothetical protein